MKKQTDTFKRLRAVMKDINGDNRQIIRTMQERALKLIEKEMKEAALTMDDALFVEYWGENVAPKDRIEWWLKKADELATDWIPSKSLFVN